MPTPREDDTAAPTPDLTVVLMTYNEVECLAAVADELLAALRELQRPTELLIVDDGSTDGSGALADRIAAQQPGVTVLHHPVNLGLGGVYSSGFSAARGQFVTFFPADGQFPGSILGDFRACAESADLVLGYLPDRRGTPLSLALSAVERMLYRAWLGPMPRFQGVFMIRREVLRQIPLASQGRGWAIIMELILRVNRGSYRVVGRPTPYRPRATGRSKVTNTRTALANLRQLLALRRLLR